MTLELWLRDLFPEGCQWLEFDIEPLTNGLDANLDREIKDSKMPFKWTETELQWESIINALYNHHCANHNEQLPWVMLWLLVERTNGLWRLEQAGGRTMGLQTISHWRSAMFCMRARLGVVDTWIKQQGGVAYSKWLYEA